MSENRRGIFLTHTVQWAAHWRAGQGRIQEVKIWEGVTRAEGAERVGSGKGLGRGHRAVSHPQKFSGKFALKMVYYFDAF